MGCSRIKLNGDSYKSPIQFTHISKNEADKIFSDQFARLYKQRDQEPDKYDKFEFFVERNGFGSQQDINEELELTSTHSHSGRGEPAEIKETPESKPLLIQLARRIIYENKMRLTQDANLKQQFESVRQCEQQNLKDFLF